MFGREKRMRSQFYPKPQGYYHSPVIKEKDQNMSAIVDTRDSFEKNHLPPIKINQNASQNDIPSLKGEEVNQKENNNNSVAQDRSNAYYMRSRSFSPFLEKPEQRLGVGHQKAYARVLEEQINSQKLKKVQERMSKIELERKMLADDSFYKHFEGDHNISAEKPSRRKPLLRNYEEVLEQDLDRLSKRDFTTIENKSVIEQRFTTIDSNEDQNSSPNRFERTEKTPDTIRGTNAFAIHQKNLDEDQVKTKTKTYLKKLEYKMALEQQITEQKLKKKHEQEMNTLEGKYEAMRNSYTRLKAKAAQERPSSKMPGEKPQGRARVPPIFVYGAEGATHQTEGNNTKTTIRRPSSSRKLVPPQHIANSESKMSSRVSSRSKATAAAEKRNQTISDDYYHQRASLNYASLPTHQMDDDNVTNYSAIQYELNKIQNDIKGHMNRMDTKLVDIKHEIIFNQKQNRELLNNRDVLHRQLIHEHPNLVTTPFNIREPFVGPKHRLLGATATEKVIDAMASKQSLLNETQMVPLTEMSATKVASKNYGSTQTSHFSSTRKENKTKSVEKQATGEYDSFVKNIVTYTKKLEQTISKQKQKINQDLGNIQNEIRQLKKKKTNVRDSFFMTEPAVEGSTQNHSTVKASAENSPIKETPLSESAVGSTSQIPNLKTRNHSRDIQHPPKGVKRTREDYISDEKKDEMPPQNNT